MFGLPIPAWAAQLLVRAGIVLGVMIAGAVAWTWCPLIGPHAVEARQVGQIASWKTSSDKWQAAAEGWEDSFHKGEALRGQETTAARAAVDDDAKACETRVAEARRSAQALKTLLAKETKIDPATHCPVRMLLPASGLQDALQPSAAR